MNKQKVEARVSKAIHEILSIKSYVSAIDVFIAMGLLDQKNVDAWRIKKVPYLERVIQVNLGKISLIMKTIRQNCLDRGLKPSLTHYKSWGKGAKLNLQFSKSGDRQIELAYATHYIRQKENIE